MATGDFGAAVAQAIKGRIKSVNGTPADALGNVNVTVAAPTPGGYDVILLAGQSNMVGYNAVPANVAITDPGHPLIFQTTGAHPTFSLQAAAEPIHGGWGIGPGFTFARWYVESGLNQGRKVLLVPAAQGGTALTTSVGWNPATAGSLYDKAVDEANYAVAAESGSKLVAVLWVQGESDGQVGATGPQYEAKLDELIAGFRAEITTGADVPFIIGQMVPEFAQSVQRAPIDAVHQSTPGRVARTAFAPGPLGLNDGGGDHYTAAGCRELGRRMFEAWRRVASSLPAVDQTERPVVVSHTAPTNRHAVWVDVSGVAEPIKVWNTTTRAWVTAVAGLPTTTTTTTAAATTTTTTTEAATTTTTTEGGTTTTTTTGTPWPTVSDDFNRAAGALAGSTTPVGGKTWRNVSGAVNVYASATGSNTARSASGTAVAACDFGQADMEASNVVKVSASYVNGPTVRANGTDQACYRFQTGNSRNGLITRRGPDGTEESLTAALPNSSWDLGDRLGLRAVEDGMGGTVISLLINGEVKQTYTDTTVDRPMGTWAGFITAGAGEVDDWQCVDPT